jgi:hypothetical protein
MQIAKKLVATERLPAIRFIAAIIHELTVVARGAYDAPNHESEPRAVNEAIHRLSGHLRDLCDSDEVLTASRAEGISEATKLLGYNAMSPILSHSPL